MGSVPLEVFGHKSVCCDSSHILKKSIPTNFFFSVLYQQEKYDDKGKIFLDPNTLSEDGTTFIRNTRWTEDGTIFAFGISEKGSDWVTIKVSILFNNF